MRYNRLSKEAKKILEEKTGKKLKKRKGKRRRR